MTDNSARRMSFTTDVERGSQPIDATTNRTILAALIPCLIGTLVLGMLSNGVHHDDDLVHFLMARWARWYPEYLLHVWGRPGATIPLAALAWIGDREVAWHVCRALSAVVTAAGAYIAARLALRIGIRPPWLVVLACYLQPLTTVLAGTTLTENFTALYLISAVALIQTGRMRCAALVFSITLLTRHEALIFVPIWWFGLALTKTPLGRKLQAAGLSLWAPIVYNLVYHFCLDEWPVRVFFAAKGTTEFSATHPLGYLPHALEAVPPMLFGLALIGGIALIRRRLILIPALAGTFFVTHCAVTALNVFASGGYARFMVAVAPLMAILIVAGWMQVIDVRRTRSAAVGYAIALAAVWIVGLYTYVYERRAGRLPVYASPISTIRFAFAGLLAVPFTIFNGRSPRHATTRLRYVAFAMLGLTVLIQFAAIVEPMRLKPAQLQVVRAADWLKVEGLDSRQLFAANPWFSYELDLVEDPTIHKGPALFASLPVDTIILVDSVYSPSYFHKLPLQGIAGDTQHYKWLKTLAADPTDPQQQVIHAFLKIGATPPATQPDRPYPPTFMHPRRDDITSYYIRPVN